MANRLEIPDYGLTSLKAKRARNLGPLKKAVYSRFRRLWIDAARVFVFTALKYVPTDSGMSAAAFLPLAAELRIKKDIKIQAKFGPKRYGYDGERIENGIKSIKDYGYGESHEGRFGTRTKTRGELIGDDCYTINYGSVNRLLMSFEFRILVFQHLYWEDRRWHSLEKGEAAMLKFIDDNYDIAPYEVTELAIRWLETGEGI